MIYKRQVDSWRDLGNLFTMAQWSINLLQHTNLKLINQDLIIVFKCNSTSPIPSTPAKGSISSHIISISRSMGSSKDKFISERCIVQKRMISPCFSSIIIRKDNSLGSCSKQTKTTQSMFHTLNSFFISGCKELEKEEKWDQLLEEACIIGKSSSKRLPGILSALSPESATTSTNCEGFSAPYLLTKSSTPNETILQIQIMKINYLNQSV